MTIFRVQHQKNYTVVNNHICKDNRLSYKAKGIWLYAFSRPDDWTFIIEDLINQSTDGRDSVRTGLKELENAGYLTRSRLRDEKGQLSDAEWIFFELPQKEELKESLPKTENPTQDNLTQENHPLPNTELLRSKENNNSGGCSFEEKEKRDLFKETSISQDVIKRSLPFSLKAIALALECLKYGKYEDCNAFFWSALSLEWQPTYPKDVKQAQESNKEDSERDYFKNIIHQLYDKYHLKMKEGYELRKSIDGNILFKNKIKNTMFPIEFNERGMNDFHFVIDNFTIKSGETSN